LKGGKADKMTLRDIAAYWADKQDSPFDVIYDICQKQYTIGLKIEAEHTKDPAECAEIVKDHIKEDLKYYTNAKPKDWAKKELKKEKVDEGEGEEQPNPISPPWKLKNNPPIQPQPVAPTWTNIKEIKMKASRLRELIKEAINEVESAGSIFLGVEDPAKMYETKECLSEKKESTKFNVRENMQKLTEAILKVGEVVFTPRWSGDRYYKFYEKSLPATLTQEERENYKTTPLLAGTEDNIASQLQDLGIDTQSIFAAFARARGLKERPRDPANSLARLPYDETLVSNVDRYKEPEPDLLSLKYTDVVAPDEEPVVAEPAIAPTPEPIIKPEKAVKPAMVQEPVDFSGRKITPALAELLFYNGQLRDATKQASGVATEQELVGYDVTELVNALQQIGTRGAKQAIYAIKNTNEGIIRRLLGELKESKKNNKK
jgi:hypothetical protein